MIQTLIHKSNNNNSYIYDDQHRLSMLIHPEFEKAYDNSLDVDLYYQNKYNYLKDNGFFSEPKIVNFEKLDEFMVKDSIIQTKQIVFNVTDSCNLNCTYCSYGELYEGFEGGTHKDINTEYAIFLLKYIINIKPKNKKYDMYIGFYGGEPLLNSNFIKQIVDETNQIKLEKDINFKFSLTTNATLIQKHIDLLVDNKFLLLISLDGNKENHSYRSFRKNNKNSFQRVIKNIDFIQKNYPEYFSAFVNFNAVLHNRNSMKDIYEFIYNRYKKIPRVGELMTDCIKSENQELFDNIFHSKIKSEIEYKNEEPNLLHIAHKELSSYKELANFLKYYLINYYISNIAKLINVSEILLPTNTCVPFYKKVFLTSSTLTH